MVEAEGPGQARVLPNIFGNSGVEIAHPKLGVAALPTGFQPQSLKCPECSSGKIWRDGKRWNDEKIAKTQRYICRDCGFRFSEKPLNAESNLPMPRQICAPSEAKNLDLAQQQKTCAGDAKLPEDAAGLIAQFLAYLEKEGFSDESKYPAVIRRLAKLGANLRDPEDVKAVIGGQKVKGGMKLQYVYAYNALATMLKISWDPPKYKQEEIIPFIPDESELDALISASKSRKVSTYLQTLKETYADPTEALRIEWIDVNEKEQTIKINHPVKGHLPRTLQVSNRLLSMINCLPRVAPRVFNTKYQTIASTYIPLRKRVAEKLQNPRILSIELRTFRHWGGTMIAYHTNGNVLLVKKLLGHKRVENSMKYIGMINFKDDQFETTSATTVEEVMKLGQAGWVEYSVVKAGGLEVHCFKKPKRFSNYV